MNVPVASEFPGARDCHRLCSWGRWPWVKSKGQRPGPGLPDQSLKCQTHLGAAEFSHVSATFACVLRMTALRPSRCVPGGLYTDGAGQKVTARLRSGWARRWESRAWEQGRAGGRGGLVYCEGWNPAESNSLL